MKTFKGIFKRSILWLAGLCFAFLCNFGSAQANTHDFLASPENGQLVISPGGKYIAYVRYKSRKYCKDDTVRKAIHETNCDESEQVTRFDNDIVIIDLDTRETAKVIIVPMNTYVGWLEFGSDSKLLASIVSPLAIGVQRNRIMIGGARTMSISIVDDTPGKTGTVMLFEDQKNLLRSNMSLAKITNLLRDDPDHILMPARKGGDLDLWKVNIHTGVADRVVKGKTGTFFWYTDANGKPIFRYDCRGRCRKIKIYAARDGEKWEKIREVKLSRDQDFEDLDFLPVAATENPTQFYVVSRDDQEERRAVKIFDIETKEILRTVYEHPRYDVDGAFPDPKSGAYMGAKYYADRLQYELNDSTLQKHYDGINRFFDNEANVEILGWNTLRTKLVIYVTAHNIAGTYYLYNLSTKNVEPLLDKRPKLQDLLKSEARVIDIPTRDGSTISAYHYFPEGKMSGRPMIIMPHGGPQARDYFDYDQWVQYFVFQGFQVVQVNFRGSTGYGRAFQEAGFGEWGGLMQDDITDTVKYFHNRGISTPRRTCIVGYSFGGYAALHAGASTPDLYNCVVSGGGVSDLLQTLRDDKKTLEDDVYLQLVDSIGDPKEDKKKLIENSPVFMAANFKSPVLILHGENDERVKFEQAEKMAQALKVESKDVTFIPLKKAKHSGWSRQITRQYLEQITLFVSKHTESP